jgi:hypothetical protein
VLLEQPEVARIFGCTSKIPKSRDDLIEMFKNFERSDIGVDDVVNREFALAILFIALKSKESQ